MRQNFVIAGVALLVLTGSLLYALVLEIDSTVSCEQDRTALNNTSHVNISDCGSGSAIPALTCGMLLFGLIGSIVLLYGLVSSPPQPYLPPPGAPPPMAAPPPPYAPYGAGQPPPPGYGSPYAQHHPYAPPGPYPPIYSPDPYGAYGPPPGAYPPGTYGPAGVVPPWQRPPGT